MSSWSVLSYLKHDNVLLSICLICGICVYKIIEGHIIDLINNVTLVKIPNVLCCSQCSVLSLIYISLL